MLIHRISFLLVATFLIGASTAAFVRVAHAGQLSQTPNQSSQNSTSGIDLSQLSPVDIYFNDTLVWRQVLYGSVTQYLFIPQGQWIVKVNSSASNMSSGSSNIDLNQTISINQEANYTLAIFQSQPSGNQSQPGNQTTSEGGAAGQSQSQSQTQNQTQQGQGQQSQSQTQTQQQSQGTGLGDETQPSNQTSSQGSQSSLTISLFLEQLNATSSDAYVKLYNFVPNTQISLVLLNQSSGSNNMSTGGTNESTSALNSNPPAPSTNESTSGQQTIIPSVPFGNASDYTAIPQTAALQQLALLVNGQQVPLDDFKMNSSYLNYSFVQNFDFRFLRMGDKYSIFAMPAVPTVRQFYLFGNDTMSSVSQGNSSQSSPSNTSSDIVTQITRDDLPVAVSYIRFVSGVPNTQFSPVLDNQTITPVSVGNASNFYLVYAGLHAISQSSQGGSNQTGSENQTAPNTTSSSSGSQLFFLTPSAISDYVLAGSESNTTTALIPSYITFPLDLNESALKLVNLVSDSSLTLMITSQNQSMNSNTSTTEVMFLNASNYVVLNSSSYSLVLMQNNQTIAQLNDVQLTPTTYFTVFAISGAGQQNVSSQNETGAGNTTSSQVQLIVVMDTQTIPLPIGSYARFIVSLSSASQATSTNETSPTNSTSGQTNTTLNSFIVMIDDVLEVDVNNGDVTSYLSMPSGQRNISLMNTNGDIIASSIVVITPNSTQSILIFGEQQSVQFAVAQDTRRAAMSLDSVRMRLVNLDVNSQSISLVQSQSTLISNVSSGNWSSYQDVMAQNLQLSSLSLSAPSGQSPIMPLQSSSQQNLSQNQNQSQTLNPYFAYSIIAQSGSSASQNSSNSTMGVIVSDSTFQLQDICFVRFVLASPDAPAVDIFMNDLLVYSNLMPQNSSFYIPVIKGLFNVSVVPSMTSGSTNQTMGEGSLNQTLGNETTATNQSTSAPLLSTLVSFQSSSFFTFAIIEPSQNMSYVVLEDKVIPSKQMANESAQVRVVNLAFDTQGLSVSASSSLGKNISIANDLDYLLASDYVNVQPGQYTFLVSQGTSGSVLRNISMELLSRNFYTIWITNSNQTSVTNRSHHGAFIDRQITIDNGAYWLDDIEDWAGNVKDWENDQFEPISSSNSSTGGSTGNFTGNSTASNQTSTSSPSNSFMFGMGRYDDQVFFGEFIFNTTSMNISETESSRQTRMIMGQWDRIYRTFYLAKGDPFGLGLALPRKV